MKPNLESENDHEISPGEKLAYELPLMDLAPWEEGMRMDGTVPERKSFWALTVDDWREAWGRRWQRFRGRGEAGAKP
jgi:hypothetical protein